MCLVVVVVFIFFFQAEDGIRDLVRSRGLGDVYKRQLRCFDQVCQRPARSAVGDYYAAVGRNALANGDAPVSYTHLTLPTSDLV